MDLSLLNPQTLLAKIGVFVLWSLIVFVGGFYSGCEFKQNQWDAEKFKQVEKAKELERKDASAGTKKIDQLKQDEKQAGEGKAFVANELAKNNPLIVKKAKPTIVIAGETKKEEVKVETQPGTIKDEDSDIYLTVAFMRMYDVSVSPGDAEIRTRTYTNSEGTEIVQGFREVIIPNNEECAATRNQLTRLIERIREKQKIYAQ